MIFSRRVIPFAGITIFVCGFNAPHRFDWNKGQGQPRGLREYPVPLVREEQSVRVGGAEEVWRLKWKSAPKPFCDDETLAPTCPCDGFAPGERGDLDLIRLRRGVEIDRFNLTALFKGPDVGSRTEDEPAVQRVAQVIHLGDYHHDGLATEFFLQTDAKPCSKHYGVVVGITNDNPRLHAFATVGYPDIPLFMRIDEWEKLRTATGVVNTVDWNCGDHGMDAQIEFELHWSPKGIDGFSRTFACLADGRRGKLLAIARDPL
jgi:hypothetical protein